MKALVIVRNGKSESKHVESSLTRARQHAAFLFDHAVFTSILVTPCEGCHSGKPLFYAFDTKAGNRVVEEVKLH